MEVKTSCIEALYSTLQQGHLGLPYNEGILAYHTTRASWPTIQRGHLGPFHNTLGILAHPITRASSHGPSYNKGILSHPTTRASCPIPQHLGHIGPSYIDNWPCFKGIYLVRADILLVCKCSNTPVIRLFSSDIPVIRL